MGLPPSLGADHETRTTPFPPVAVTPVADKGTVAAGPATVVVEMGLATTPPELGTDVDALSDPTVDCDDRAGARGPTAPGPLPRGLLGAWLLGRADWVGAGAAVVVGAV